VDEVFPHHGIFFRVKYDPFCMSCGFSTHTKFSYYPYLSTPKKYVNWDIILLLLSFCITLLFFPLQVILIRDCSTWIHQRYVIVWVDCFIALDVLILLSLQFHAFISDFYCNRWVDWYINYISFLYRRIILFISLFVIEI
jgi:hypothetical protein